MFTRLSVLALALIAGVDAKSIDHANGKFDAASTTGQNLMKHARRVQDNNYGNYQQYQNQGQDGEWEQDASFLVGYNVKFQGCHHVQQWNADAADEEDVRIMTKRLVRFRLCPASECTTDLAGCTSNYGDYVVDMETFVGAYYEAMAAQYQGNRALQDIDYTQCQQVDMDRMRKLQNENGQYGEDMYGDYYDGDYYVGPYCADQGGEIRLGVFTDDTCTSFAQNGEQKYYAATGYALPYSDSTMVSTQCMGCSGYNDGDYQVSDFCSEIYQTSGKCETKMNVGYPNESSCSYIEGIKIIREDGVIRTGSTKKSKAAAVCIGVFLTIAVLLAGYVYYLRTKLGRAKINLAAANQTL